MVEKSTTEESKTTTPFDFTNLAGGFDPSKMMDQFSKVLGDYRVPGVAVTAVLVAAVDSVAAHAVAWAVDWVPAAVERGMLDPVMAMASKTSSIPSTVPSNPSSGQTLMSVGMSG